MKWEGNRQSDNVEDARTGGGGRGFPIGGGRGLGLGSVVIALLAGWIFGINPLTVLGVLSGVDGGSAAPSVQQSPATRPPAGDRAAAFVSTLLADTEDVWAVQFKQAGRIYQDPKLRLFRGSEPTACGQGDAAMGPFYCPGDRKVYIDLEFFDTLSQRLGAPGDFAQAYVIAHEVGHHVQNLLGISGKVDAMRGRVSAVEQNSLSVRLELQADCLAGVWAHDSQKSKGWLESGDVEEALQAASQIGDDTLQRRSRGSVVPESFTHGTSAQRIRWFQRGLQAGSLEQCNSFNKKPL
ncbi:MAG: metalloprotease [Burkholderiales bacterium 28-67-8]|nr:MAG: metalloprotease [Burkholderiales bacterium 28-67-8]